MHECKKGMQASKAKKITRVAFKGGAGGHLPSPPCWMFARLRFYYKFFNVQHVALAPPPWYAETAILHPLEQNPKCSPVY